MVSWVLPFGMPLACRKRLIRWRENFRMPDFSFFFTLSKALNLVVEKPLFPIVLLIPNLLDRFGVKRLQMQLAKFPSGL